jgi:hypothetical protein
MFKYSFGIDFKNRYKHALVTKCTLKSISGKPGSGSGFLNIWIQSNWTGSTKTDYNPSPKNITKEKFVVDNKFFGF